MPLRIDFNPGQLEANVRQVAERAVKGMHLKAKRRALKAVSYTHLTLPTILLV